MRSLFLSFTLGLVLCQCSTVPALFEENETEVVFALGARDGFVSPMTTALKPACPALEFRESGFELNGAHKKLLTKLAEGWKEKKPRYLIAGYTPPNMPEDYARTLSERRAQAVRQMLIESGVEAASLQTVGFGSDSTPTTNVVVIYRQ